MMVNWESTSDKIYRLLYIILKKKKNYSVVQVNMWKVHGCAPAAIKHHFVVNTSELYTIFRHKFSICTYTEWWWGWWEHQKETHMHTNQSKLSNCPLWIRADYLCVETVEQNAFMLRTNIKSKCLNLFERIYYNNKRWWACHQRQVIVCAQIVIVFHDFISSVLLQMPLPFWKLSN